jgi:PleD family two-component response regulator
MSTSRLLVVEDNRDIANVLNLYLASQGYQVKVTPRGRDALSLSRLELPSLILLDILLPDLDGYEVCRALRSSPRTGHIPIIFLTQKDERSDRITGLQLGVDDYITKPFDIEELGLRIQNVLSRTERERLTDPRTGLPGGKLVEDQVAGLLVAEAWGLLACRVEGFDRYLESRGPLAGDEVLRGATQFLAQTVDALGGPDDFIGHDWTGSFTVITNAFAAPSLAERLRQRFEDETRATRSAAEELAPGGRKHDPPPRLYLSVGVVTAGEGPFARAEDLIEAAARARRRDAYESAG